MAIRHVHAGQNLHAIHNHVEVLSGICWDAAKLLSLVILGLELYFISATKS